MGLNKKKKRTSSSKGFFKTFIIAFILFTVIFTPSLALLGKVADGRFIPTAEGEEKVTLRDELPFIVNEDSPFFEAFKNTNRVNVLLLGVNDGLTDTIILASFDMDVKHVDLISIPRDTYYHRKGYNGDAENKLNAAYRKNPVNTAKAVSEILLGMPINYYAVIDYKGIENIVDSMGGVPMTIKKGGMYYNDPYDKPPLKIAIPEGDQLLDGKKAVEFLRYRSGYKDGDIGRVKAQQEFMKSAFRQCLSFDLPKIAKTVFNNVDSDITIGMVTKLATRAIGMSGDSISTYLMPANYQDEAPWYVYPESKGIAEMINEIYSIEPETTDGETEAED
jgi:LCP family protein required for cell wall assembly